MQHQRLEAEEKTLLCVGFEATTFHLGGRALYHLSLRHLCHLALMISFFPSLLIANLVETKNEASSESLHRSYLARVVSWSNLITAVHFQSLFVHLHYRTLIS